MKQVLIDFIALRRKYIWAYAENDASVIEWLLQVSRSHEVKITLMGGFSFEEIDRLLDHECFLIGKNSMLPKVKEQRSIKQMAA